MVASCEGSDSGGDSAAPGSAETATATGAEAATESDASADAATVTDTPSSGDEADDRADASRASPNCEAIFSLAEIEEFFAEPVELTEGTDDDLGQLLCTWVTIEDSEELEDLGDLAYATDSLGPAFFFVDEPVGGSLSYSEMAMGTDAPHMRTADDVERLFRTFHDRVT